MSALAGIEIHQSVMSTGLSLSSKRIGERYHLIDIQVTARPDGGGIVVVQFTKYPSRDIQQRQIEIEPGAFRSLREQMTVAAQHQGSAGERR